MVDTEMRSYWILVRAHRQGDQSALLDLELLSAGKDRGAKKAALYLLQQSHSGNTAAS